MLDATHVATVAWLQFEVHNTKLLKRGKVLLDSMGHRFNPETGRCQYLWPVIVVPTLRPVAAHLEVVR